MAETYVVLPCNPVAWDPKKPGQRHCESGLASLGPNQPYFLTTFPDTYRGDSYQYTCSCGGISRISFEEFMRRPRWTVDQLRALGLVTWEEHKLEAHEARDLIEAGFTPSDVKELKR